MSRFVSNTARHFVRSAHSPPVLSWYRGLFSFPETFPFSESGTPESSEIRSHIGRQSVGRTLRGLLLSRRSLPFKTASCPHFPPPSLSLSQPLYPDPFHRSQPCFSSHPPAYLVPPSRATFLSSLRPALPFAPLRNRWFSCFPPSSTLYLTSPSLATLMPTGEFLALRLLFRVSSAKPRWRNLGEQIRRGRNPRGWDFRDFHSGLVSRA